MSSGAKTSNKKVLSIEEITDEVDFSIYPNPSSGRFSISYRSELDQDLQIRLLDVTGKVIMDAPRKVIREPNEFELNVLNHVPEGLYFLQINGQDQRVTRKVIIEN